MDPIRVNRGIQALYVSPSRMFIGVGVVVAETYPDDVIRSKRLLYGFGDGSLGFALREIIGDECRAYTKLGWIADSSASRDAYV